MAEKETKTIVVSKETWARLGAKVKYHETMDGIISQLLDLSDKIEAKRDGKGRYSKQEDNK